MTSPFERFDDEDVRTLIAEYPLAWVIARGTDDGDGSLLPLVGVHDAAGRRDWGPTWNYAQLTVRGEITLESGRTGEALDILIQAVEHHRATPWQADELGPRYAGLLDQIIGFRLCVDTVRGKFKLEQDETAETLRAILDNHPDPALRRWMRRLNRARL